MGTTQKLNQVCSSSVTALQVVLLVLLPSASYTHSILQEPDLLLMLVAEDKENSQVLLITLPRLLNLVFLNFTTVSVSPSLVSLPTESLTSVCSIPVKLYCSKIS